MLHPQVEIFLQVVESGSFSKAALIRSCSAVSIMNQINSLEDRLGMKLLARTSQGVSLTESGEIFHKEACRLKNISDEAIRKAKGASQKAALPVILVGTSLLRPSKPLLDYLAAKNRSGIHKFQIKIVPFNDSQEEFSRIQNALGKEIDCFISPCNSASWISKLNIFRLGQCGCFVTLSRNHRLAAKKTLEWQDLYGERLMLVAKGISPVLDQLRTEIITSHPDITIYDSPNYYDIEVFNRCAQEGYLMETPEIWSDLHPALTTLPVAWGYAHPYGVVYSKNPSPAFKKFINLISEPELGDKNRRF